MRLRISKSDVWNGGLDANREIPRVLSLVGLDIEEKKEREQFFSGNETAAGYSYGFVG